MELVTKGGTYDMWLCMYFFLYLKFSFFDTLSKNGTRYEPLLCSDQTFCKPLLLTVQLNHKGRNTITTKTLNLWLWLNPRPGVAGAVLKTPLSLIDLVGPWPFSSRYSTNLPSQAVRAKELKFFEIVHLPPPVTYHMSRVTCHMSHYTCHMFFLLFCFWQSVEISR